MSQRRGKVVAMNTIELWRWWITDPCTGRRTATRYRMTEADALAVDAGAESVPGSLEVRPISTSPGGNCTSAWLTRPTVGQTDV